MLLVCSTGKVLLYTAEDEQRYSGELVGSFPAGLQAAQVSPDDELLALLAGDGQIIIMSRSGLFPTSEGSLSDMARVWSSQSVSVGWGRKETQFHGKAGKQAALAKAQVEEQRLTENDDGRGRISWRNDGAYLAISFVNGSTAEPHRQIVIMDREGRVVAVNEPREGLGQALAWRPDGLLAVSQSPPQGGPHRVIFFEANGLGHGEFCLAPGDGPIAELAWNADGTILSMILDGGRTLLWATENYHWYLKYSLPGKCSSLHWSRARQPHGHSSSMLLHYLTSWGGIVEYQFMFRIDRSSCMGDDGLCLVATIDGSKVLLTPFARANVPPPMAFAQVELDGPVNCVAVYCATDGTRLAVATPGGHVSIFLLGMRDGGSMMESALLSSFATHHSNLKQIIFQDVETLFCLPDDGLQLELPDGAGSRRVDSYCSRMGRLLYSDVMGTVYVDDHTVLLLNPSQGVAVWSDFFIANDQLHYVSLDHAHRLLINNELIATDCTSFIIHPEFFCLTTPTGLLRFYPLSRPVSQWTFIAAADGGEEEESSRLSEGGAKCVAVVPKAAALVLKMPRGNLETVYPRAFVLSQIRRLLSGLAYREALLLCRRHRVDLNIIHDANPELFMRTLQKFVQQVPEVDYLNLFLSSLKAENVAATRYRVAGGEEGTQGGVESVPREYPDKVNKVCQAVLHLLSQDSSAKYAETIMTAHVCQSPPQVEQALRRIIDLAGSQEVSFVERAIKYLCFLVPAERLYRVALGLYNLPLALTIARRSSMDPAEYTAFLEELHSLDNPRERQFRIDDFLQRLALALENLIESGAPFERCLEYTARHQLYPVAFRLYASVPDRRAEWRQLCGHYGAQLIQQGGDAATVVDLLQFSGAQGGAVLEAAIRAGLWERVVQLVPPEAPAFGPASKRLIASLREQGQLGDATVFAELYLGASEALSLAIEGQLWSTGARICHKAGLEKKQLLTAALRQASTVAEELAQMMLDFDAKSTRLELLQQKLVDELDPAKIMAALEASGGDSANVGGRTASEMSFRTSTTTFGGSQISQLSRATTSKSKRKAERQRTRGKPGSPFEREFLRDAIREIVRRLEGQRRASIDLVRFLAGEEHFVEARVLQRTLAEGGSGVQSWCDRMRRLVSVQEEKMGPEVLAALGMTAFTIPPALQITHEWRTAFETDPTLSAPILPYLAD